MPEKVCMSFEDVQCAFRMYVHLCNASLEFSHALNRTNTIRYYFARDADGMHGQHWLLSMQCRCTSCMPLDDSFFDLPSGMSPLYASLG